MSNIVKIYPEQVLKIWCEEHHRFHTMTYEYLLSLVPAQSHSAKEVF